MKDGTRGVYRQCFMTGSGKATLGHILVDAGYFDDAKTPEDMAMQNMAKQILRNSGLFPVKEKPSTVKSYVESLFNIGIQ